jgi:glycosyltransferase involved in cell wall biosynthesis
MARPVVSVLFATYNRRGFLARALAAWEQQELEGATLEVVVGDDGSDDGSADLLRAYECRRFELRHVSVPHSGGAAAPRNAAYDLARGDLIVFVGDDIVPRAGFLQAHLAAHAAGRDAAAAYLGYSGWPGDMPLTATMRHITEVGGQQFSYLWFVDGGEYDFRHFYTSNISVRRELLDAEPALFATDMIGFEDIELSHRLRRHGLRIHYLAAARAFHYHLHTVASFWRRQVDIGRMAVYIANAYPELRKWMRTRDVEWAWLRLLAAGESVAGRRAAAELERLERRVIDLAGHYDFHWVPAVDELLREVFDYALLKGVAVGVHGEDAARPVAAHLFAERVLPAVERFADAVRATGAVLPRADYGALHAVA